MVLTTGSQFLLKNIFFQYSSTFHLFGEALWFYYLPLLFSVKLSDNLSLFFVFREAVLLLTYLTSWNNSGDDCGILVTYRQLSHWPLLSNTALGSVMVELFQVKLFFCFFRWSCFLTAYIYLSRYFLPELLVNFKITAKVYGSQGEGSENCSNAPA